MPGRRFLVEGRVQGVFFRASTANEAERLGLTGHAINLPDGRVEVIAWGEDPALDALAAWLSEGPAQARVDRLDTAFLPAELRVPPDFRTG